MSELSVYNSDEIPPETERRIRSLVTSEWPATDDDILTSPLLEPDLHPVFFVLTRGDDVLSYGRTIQAWVPNAGRTLKVYGLGDVVTAPEHRGLGFGGRIVEATTAHIRSDPEADVGVLLTEPALQPWYGRYGWTQVPGLRVRTDEYHDAATAGVVPMFLVLSTALAASGSDLHERTLTLPGCEW